MRKEVTERNQPVQANLRTEELVVKGDEDLIEQPNPNAPPTSTYERERTRRG